MSHYPLLAAIVRWSLLVAFALGVVVDAVWGQLDSSDLVGLAFLAYVAVGFLVSVRRPENPIGWVFLLVGFFIGLSGWSDALVTQALSAGQPDVWYGVLGAWIGSWFWYPGLTLATLFTVLLFPDGLPSPRWRPVLWLSVTVVSLYTVLAATAPTLMVSETAHGIEVTNPLALGLDSNAVSRLELLLAPIIFTCSLLAVVGAVVRTRRASGAARQQMKLFTLAAAITIGWIVFGTDAWEEYSLLNEVALALAIGLIPVACGIAILRYHLYDIDRVVSRTTAYAIVTGLVLATYLAVVTVTTQLLPDSGSLPVAAATLVAAGVVRPVLRRVQDVVDRRFNRARVDARHTVETFAARLQHELDDRTVALDLVSAVRSSLAPATVGVWVPAQHQGGP